MSGYGLTCLGEGGEERRKQPIGYRRRSEDNSTIDFLGAIFCSNSSYGAVTEEDTLTYDEAMDRAKPDDALLNEIDRVEVLQRSLLKEKYRLGRDSPQLLLSAIDGKLTKLEARAESLRSRLVDAQLAQLEHQASSTGGRGGWIHNGNGVGEYDDLIDSSEELLEFEPPPPQTRAPEVYKRTTSMPTFSREEEDEDEDEEEEEEESSPTERAEPKVPESPAPLSQTESPHKSPQQQRRLSDPPPSMLLSNPPILNNFALYVDDEDDDEEEEEEDSEDDGSSEEGSEDGEVAENRAVVDDDYAAETPDSIDDVMDGLEVAMADDAVRAPRQHVYEKPLATRLQRRVSSRRHVVKPRILETTSNLGFGAI